MFGSVSQKLKYGSYGPLFGVYRRVSRDNLVSYGTELVSVAGGSESSARLLRVDWFALVVPQEVEILPQASDERGVFGDSGLSEMVRYLFLLDE